ncbi:hypothetical protein CU664_12085 [Pseudomonas syringae pv. actinidifoliorum]|uniref:RHS repeat-associated core domain-containing protein n=1 Tax=Pseudomonas syringae TaxID=317 RepID=UPI0013736CCC|nr:RHS repeat-associated core domain-containing protein [Pseudomonas syringae]NAS96806.1 hypothetical protein [Pseudomonas syringae pv. actinidifoliorum]NAT63965.1 hypothetical protein [Pseudomonas syringae pv. actinidifoliorum]
MPQPISLCRYRYDALDRTATRTPLAKAIADVSRQSGPRPGFNGELLDDITGHYLLGNGYRAYNPVLMRFNSPDSLSPFGKGGLNAYAYCGGDPINKEDSTGHMFITKTRLGLSRPRVRPPVQPSISSPAANMNLSGFGKLNDFLGTPHILDEILAYLPGDALVSLSLSSRSMKSLVDTSVKKLIIEKPANELSRETIYKLRAISSGEVLGHTPSQVLKWQNIKDMAREIPRADIPMEEIFNTLAWVRDLNGRRPTWRL